MIYSVYKMVLKFDIKKLFRSIDFSDGFKSINTDLQELLFIAVSDCNYTSMEQIAKLTVKSEAEAQKLIDKAGNYQMFFKDDLIIQYHMLDTDFSCLVPSLDKLDNLLSAKVDTIFNTYHDQLVEAIREQLA